MLAALIIDDEIRFGESNTDDRILIEQVTVNKEGNDEVLVWDQIGFVHIDEVVQLRDWLSDWINSR
jgi:hypothetical protein